MFDLHEINSAQTMILDAYRIMFIYILIPVYMWEMARLVAKPWYFELETLIK